LAGAVLSAFGVKAKRINLSLDERSKYSYLQDMVHTYYFVDEFSNLCTNRVSDIDVEFISATDEEVTIYQYNNAYDGDQNMTEFTYSKIKNVAIDSSIKYMEDFIKRTQQDIAKLQMLKD
jgi:hypothetical protein